MVSFTASVSSLLFLISICLGAVLLSCAVAFLLESFSLLADFVCRQAFFVERPLPGSLLDMAAEPAA
ncbi:MAG: hypothetical protein VB858_14885 [Planctomycetaceae bacterium]